MGSSPTTATDRGPSARFLAAFRARAGDPGVLSFAEFMDLALYDETVGYYRRAHQRIGYGGATDFFTASTSGPIFGELVSAACVALLEGRPPGDHVFVEIGAESEAGILKDVSHPFAEVRTVRVGEQVRIPPRAIVFSNEVFDAQPLRRFVFRAGEWRERGVALRRGILVEVELPGADVPAELCAVQSPAEGYEVDASWAAAQLMSAIAAQPWAGLLLAFDYGKTWRELIEATPQGTARAYYRHTQDNDLLARPGEQDLTGHVCWDWLEASMRVHGFARPQRDSQEAFLVKFAGPAIAAISKADAARFSRRKQALQQLLHPTHLGQKFQVLHGTR